MSETITWQEALALISPEGQAELVALVRKAREERGAGYLEAIKEEFPAFCWIADLVANHDAETCYTELQKEFGFSIGLVKRQIVELHAALRAEIDKPR